MLSGETANGPYFEEAVKVMARTCVEAENSRNYNALYQAIRNSCMKEHIHFSSGEALASSAAKTAMDIDANMILVLSETGRTARLVAKFRPGRTIVCLTTNSTVARQCSGTLTGVHAYLVDSLQDTDYLINEVITEAIKIHVLKEGDKVVTVCGTNHGHGHNDMIRVEIAHMNYWDEEGEVKAPRGKGALGEFHGHLSAGFHFA